MGRHLRLGLIGVLTTALLSSALRAQEPDPLRITRAEFERHAQELDLTIAQRDAAERMFTAYEREFDDAAAAYRQVSDWLWSNTNSHSWYGGESRREFSDTLSRQGWRLEELWNIEARRLEQHYFSELRRFAIGWDEAIDALWRRRLRTRMLDFNEDGSGADLVALVEELGIIRSAAIDAVLGDYERALHEILLAIDERSITHRGRLRDAYKAAHAAKQAGKDAASLYVTATELQLEREVQRAQLRPLNASTAARIAAALPPETRGVFEDAAHLQVNAFLLPAKPDEPTPERAFTAAMSPCALDLPRQAQLQALWSSYRTERRSAGVSLRALYEDVYSVERHRRFYAIYHSGQHERARAMWSEQEQRWQQALQAWHERCAAVCQAIEAIVSGPSAGAHP